METYPYPVIYIEFESPSFKWCNGLYFIIDDIEDLYKDDSHPAKIIDDIVGYSSRRKIIGVIIPQICAGVLISAAVINFIYIWKDGAFSFSSGYKIIDEDSERLQIIINFSKRLIEKSVNIDSEFVDIVNDNFWNLI